MWNQWPGIAAAAPMPPIPAPQCPPPQPPPPTAAPPPPSTAPPPAPMEPATGNVTTTIIGPMLPSTATATTPVAPPSSNGPYGQYTEAQYAALTPEQQYALQQHWQQWQAYQQEYAKWHAQYGEQYKREMAAASVTGQAMNLNNYYQQVQPQPQILTQAPQQNAPQQPPPPPPPDAGQQVNAKFPGTPQLYTQPPPPQQLQSQPMQPMQPAQPIPANQVPPTMHQPPPGGQFQNMNFSQWQQAYPHAQTQPQPQQHQFNYNQPPPSFSQQPPNFSQIPNFQQPPPMATQQHMQSQHPPISAASSAMPQKPINAYGNSNQANRSENNQSGNNINKIQPNLDRNFDRNPNIPTGPNPNLWGPNSKQSENEFNSNPGGNNIQWNSNQDKFEKNFGGNQCSPNEMDPIDNWGSRRDDLRDSNDYNDLSNDGNMNARFECNRKSRDGFENSRNSNNRWSGENSNFSQGRPSSQGGSNQWNNANRNQGNMNKAWNNRQYDSENNFDDDNRNTGNFNNQRDQSGHEHRDGGNRWGNNSGQWATKDTNDRDSAYNNNFSQGRGGNGRNFHENNSMQSRNSFNQRFGQNDRNFGGNFNQRPGGNGRDYGPNTSFNQLHNSNERNCAPDKNLDEDPEKNFDGYRDMRPMSNDRNFGNRNNFNKWSDSKDSNFNPHNNFNTNSEDGGRNSNTLNPFNPRSLSNDRNFEPIANVESNMIQNQAIRGNGRNDGPNDNFNRRTGSNDNFNQGTDPNESNFEPERSSSNERKFGPNNNFNRRLNSNERIREPVPNIGARGQDDRALNQIRNETRDSQNQDHRAPEIKKDAQGTVETENQNRQPRTDLDEKSFDLQFQRWEEQFEQWKRANANHPDREMYRRYEQEFEKQRTRIMERREQMRLRKLQQKGTETESLGNKNCDTIDIEDQKHTSVMQPKSNDENEEIKEVLEDQIEENEGNEENEESKEPSSTEDKITVMDMEIIDAKESDDKEDAEKETAHEKEETQNKNDSSETFKEVFENKELPILERKTISFGILGKRKSRFSAPIESGKLPKTADVAATVPDVISLVDEEDNISPEASGAMCNIFGKSEGIPGLDLVEDSAISELDSADKPPINDENEMENVPKEAQPEAQNIGGKIPSLFDVVVEKPADFTIQTPIGENDDDENDDDNAEENKELDEAPHGQQIHPKISNAIPNLGDALRDPVFMQKISHALAKAQGRDNADPTSAPPPQFLQQLPMLLQQLQQQKSKNDTSDENPSGSGGNSQNYAGNETNLGGNSSRFDGNDPNFGGNRPNFGEVGPNFGGNAQNFGRNSPNYRGNPAAFGDNGPNRPNFDGNGPNFRSNGPNFGDNRPYFGFNGPNGGNGSNFNRGGPNNRFGPNFRGGNGPNYQGGNGPNFQGGNGPNFQGGNGPNFQGGNGPNFPGGNGPNFQGGNGPNFQGGNDRNYQGSGLNFRGGGNGPPFGRNDGQNFGRNFNMPDRGRQSSFRGGGGNDNSATEDKGTCGGNDGNGTDNSNSSWADGPGKNRDYGDDFFRPVQVIDYQNSTVPRPKVIDYGHMGASTSASAAADSGSNYNPYQTKVSDFSHEFKPVQTFDYGHLSNTAPNKIDTMPPYVNAKKKNKNKKKKKKNATAQNRNALQANDTHTTSIPEQQREIFEAGDKDEDENSQQSAYPTDTNSNVSSPKAINEELEAISDNEDELEDSRDNNSPAPPPPPMLTTNKPFICSVQYDATAPNQSIFPSTATANDNENISKAPSGHVQMSFPSIENKNTISVDEILLSPGRLTRPKKICVILRGPPGSGKSHVAKLIKEKETEMGGSNPRVLSIDDYFLIENDYDERCPKTGKKIPKREVLYEYEAEMEETYMQYMIKSFKKTISDNLYDFIIVDCNNNSLRSLNEFYCHSKDSGFMPYIVDLLCDLETCLTRNTHGRSEKDIATVIDTWKATPLHYIKLDVTSLLENLVEMEDVEDMVTDNNSNSGAPDDSNLTQPQADNETEDSTEAADTTTSFGFLKSKWENDNSSENLARLDGTNRLMQKRKTATMEDYLQIDDWQPPKVSTDGKKRVRWADIEEKRAQDKMRAIGFVVGQTDWKRMMDPNAGNRALNKTKYIERVKKRR